MLRIAEDWSGVDQVAFVDDGGDCLAFKGLSEINGCDSG